MEDFGVLHISGDVGWLAGPDPMNHALWGIAAGACGTLGGEMAVREGGGNRGDVVATKKRSSKITSPRVLQPSARKSPLKTQAA